MQPRCWMAPSTFFNSNYMCSSICFFVQGCWNLEHWDAMTLHHIICVFTCRNNVKLYEIIHQTSNSSSIHDTWQMAIDGCTLLQVVQSTTSTPAQQELPWNNHEKLVSPEKSGGLKHLYGENACVYGWSCCLWWFITSKKKIYIYRYAVDIARMG